MAHGVNCSIREQVCQDGIMCTCVVPEQVWQFDITYVKNYISAPKLQLVVTKVITTGMLQRQQISVH